MVDVRIGTASRGDYGVVRDVISAAWASYQDQMTTGDWVRMCSKILDVEALGLCATILTASVQAAVVGVVAYGSPGKLLHEVVPREWAAVARMSVLPDCAGKGVGRRLLLACVEMALNEGVATIGLHTSPRMGGAVHLYTGFGFTYDSTLPSSYGWPFALYRLNLSDSPDTANKALR